MEKLLLNMANLGVFDAVWEAMSLSKYAEHDKPLAGAEGEHSVAELIYLMTERLISPKPWLESMLDEGSDSGSWTAPRPLASIHFFFLLHLQTKEKEREWKTEDFF